MKRLLGYALAFSALGYAAIPLVVAALGAGVAATDIDPPSEFQAAGALVDEVSHAVPDGLLRLTLVQDYSSVRACGYEPEILTEDRRFPELSWNYDVIRNQSAQAVANGHRQAWISDHVSPFEVEFLTRCMRASVFAPLCQRRGAALVADADAALDPGSKDFVLRNSCVYLDGVAALLGRPVVERPAGQ